MTSARRARIAVTGAGGFVGRHVVEVAMAQGHEVVAIVRSPLSSAALDGVADEVVIADLAAGWPDVGADAIIHLAGHAAVGESFDHPQRYIADTSAMMTALSESMLAAPDARRPRCVIVSTGAVYASPVDDTPLDEEAPIAPSSPYVVSKMLLEFQAEHYRRRGLDMVVARPFNHIGPRQRSGFLVPDLIASLQALPEGQQLRVGNLDTRRDYSDVRDVAAAYLMLALAPRLSRAVYNVCSGVSRSGREILALVCAALDRPVPPLRLDSTRIRATDPAVIRGSADAIRDELGWAPRVPLTQTLADLVSSWETEAGPRR
ncbi:NAD-dependent epimerase/dehydratase family protein [Microbacterium sp. NPDC055683]